MRLRSMVAAAALGLAALAGAPEAAQAMTFERLDTAPVCDTSPCVLASGEIEKDTAAEFKAFIKTNGIAPGATVVFDSPGGFLLQGLALGEAIREAGLYTAVGRFDRVTGRLVRGSQCVSACAYAFLGGVQRDVAEHARLGVHQFACAADAAGELSVSDAQALMGLIAIYMEKMVGKTTVLSLAAATPAKSTYWLSPHELRSYRVVTY